jgi:enoyl-CoA hydratase
MGLVNRVVPRTELLPAVEKMADKIRDYNPVVVSYAKQAVTRGLDLPLPQALELEARLGAGLLS